MKIIFFFFLWFFSLICFGQGDSIFISHNSQKTNKVLNVTIKGNFDYAYYSIDGSIPKSKKCKDTLTISKTTFILFRCVYKNLKKDTIIGRSYIFETKSKLPVLSIAIAHDDLWDANKGIYTRGSKAKFSDSTGHWENCNFQEKWEKPIHIVYIDSNNNSVVNQPCGIRIFGESTRRQPDKSMKIVARKKYGVKRFYYPFFKDKEIEEYKQLVIRTSGNDYNRTRFKDVMNAYLARNLGLDYMAYQPIRLYVNGEYWGVYNLREKINKHYLYYNHNAAKDSSSIVMGRWVTQHGNRKMYREMYNWFLKLDTMDDESYKKAENYLDIRNYINYRVYQIFTNNVDSRGNIRYWNSTDLDGRFRMILYDTDLSFGSLDRDYLKKCLSPKQTNWFNNTWSTMYLRKLMQNDKFKHQFINQYAHIMNTALQTDTILSAINRFQNIYKDELPRSNKILAKHLRSVPIPMEKWLKNINKFRSFAKKRPQIARKEITKQLAKDGIYYLKINSLHGTVSINNNYNLKLPFAGYYYKNIPLPIEVKADSGYIFKGWNQNNLKNDTLLTTIADSVELVPIFKKIIVKNSTKSNSIAPKVNKSNKDKLLWLLATIFLSLGSVLLIVYFKLRIKD